MPFMERIAIQEQTTISNDSGVVQIKLPKQGSLYNLDLFLQITNGATHAQDATIFDAWDLIEIVGNGSHYIFSGTPYELFQLNSYFYKALPQMKDDRVGGRTQYVQLSIPFHLMNMQGNYFLPLSQWGDIEIRLHYSPTISATDGFATGTLVYSIYADISYDNGLGNGAGYLRYRTVRTHTSVSSGVERIQIDGNFPLLGLFVNVDSDAVNGKAAYSKAEILINDGNRKIFTCSPDLYMERLARLLKIDLDFALRTTVSNTDTTTLIWEDVEALGIEKIFAAPTIGTTLIPHYSVVSLANRVLTFTAFNDTADGAATAQVAYTTDQELHIHGRFESVPGGLMIPFGMMGNMQNAIVPDNNSRVFLELTQAIASAVTRIGQLELAS